VCVSASAGASEVAVRLEEMEMEEVATRCVVVGASAAAGPVRLADEATGAR